MKKVISSSLIIILLLLGLGCNPGTTPASNITNETPQQSKTAAVLPEMSTYTGTIHDIHDLGKITNISIDYPKGWTVLSEGINYPLTFILQNTDCMYQCSVSISATSVGQPYNLLDSFQQEIKNREYNPMPGTFFNIVTPMTPISISGYPAYEITYIENRATADESMEVWILSPDNMLYTFGGGVQLTYNYDDYSGIIQHMLDSLKLW